MKQTDYRKLNLKTLVDNSSTGAKELRKFDSIDKSDNMARIFKYSRLWNDLDHARKRRKRAVSYSFGDQYSDIITDEHGRKMTEGQHIMQQGKVPIANNLILGQVKTVIGQFRANQTEPSCVSRDRDEAKLGEMMSIAMQYAYQTNKLWELDARTMHEFLHSGTAIQKVGYSWSDEKQDMTENIDMVTLPRFFFNGNIEDPRGGDFTVMGEILDWSLSDIISKLCGGNRQKALEISKIYNNIDEHSIVTSYQALSRKKINDLSFFIPTDRSKCRVICAWEKESREVLKGHDYLTGKPFIAKIEEAGIIEAMNKQRISDARKQGVAQEDVPIMTYEWHLERFWYVRYLTPTGEVLYESETPYTHKRPPYVIKISMFDGENYSFVDDLIELNRGINRLSTMVDFIISSSPKGTFIIPEEAIGLMNKEEIIDQYQAPGGVVVIKTKGLTKEQLPYTVSQNATNVGAYELLQLYMNSMKDASGVYGALQGKSPSAGTPAAQYAQESQQSSINLLDLFETFKSFRQDRDITLMQVIQQYWRTPKYMGVTGSSYNEQSRWWNPEKIRNSSFDLEIKESASTPTFIQINNSLLLDFFKANAIGIKEVLKAGSFPFGDKLLEILDQQEKELQQSGQIQTGIPPEMQQQISEGQDPNAVQQLTQAMQTPAQAA
ncbi:MAG: hypothetical protein JZU53_07010 [Paludibacter sp.]|nr:hypothetical protein [Paludibacter sp.]